MMVAVGFNPRFEVFHRPARRVATTEANQASLRAAMFCADLGPWVETHGYHRPSLRDQMRSGNLRQLGYLFRK
jgi:hypothetical protein